jgi:CO/xanthine dehydrogenase Mo-binding subunit/aerobic-type carbon monoxide dehydrogenase small subunit (CoxS/CutS family)
LLLNLTVNGQPHRIDTPPARTLLQVLREDLRLTGTKQACAVGVCGVCSVLLDGELVSACLLLAPQADGRQLTTIEGISDRSADGLHPLQQAFIDRAGFQCGICTPGQIIAATALLQEQPHPTLDQIKNWMMGNLCRCTGYHGIVESIQAAASGDSSMRSEDQRQDGVGKVSGATQYAADLSLPDVLAVGVLRSPHPHARIVSIDSRAAKALAGVRAVLVGADLPADVRVGRNMRDMPLLAREKVRFAGEKVAAVAAETADIAEQALSLIEVEYDPLPAVFDPREAMQPGAPLIHDPDLVRAWAVGDQVVADYPNAASAPSWGASENDVQAALEDADLVFEHTFHTPIQHQAYLEPHSCIVKIDEHGTTHIWATNKAPLLLARYLREGLGLQRDQLDIHMLPLGGDFGGKGSFMDIPLAIFLARASGRPVRMAMSYTDELQAGNPRHASTMVIRSGVNRDGRLVARWVRGYFASGGYAAFKPSTDTTLPGFRRGAVGPYEVPVQRTECHMVYTNTVPGGHMRSPGEAQVAYALEAHTDLIARLMGLDPVEFRRRNATRHGRPAEDGGADVAPRVREVLDAAAEAIGLNEPRPEGVGRGLALIEFSTSPGVYAGILHVARDGQVTIQTPIIENGAGMLTVFRRIVAEELGLPMHAVAIEQSLEDIDEDRGVGGSRTTRLVGKLLIQLSRRVQSRLADLLAAELGLDRGALECVSGGFKTADGRLFSFGQATSLLAEPLAESILFRAGERDRSAVFVAQAAEVAVDRETGAVTPKRVVTVQEVGRVIDPLLFGRQIEGGQLQSLGYALMEQVTVRDGHVQNVNLHEYKIPTQVDTPPTQTILVGHDLRLGITPVGEGANAGLAPAIANAVVDVIGPRVLDIPLSPERIRALIAVR